MSDRLNDWEIGVIVPIQIREDHWVRVGRIPHDLTATEAEKIAAVVRAYASGTSGSAQDAQRLDPKDDSPTAEGGDAQTGGPNG